MTVPGSIPRTLILPGYLILFPEGTSNDGNRVLPFKSALFAALQTSADLPIQPVSIGYTRLDGMPLGRALRPFVAWYGDMEMVPHLWEALLAGPIEVAPPADVRIVHVVRTHEMADAVRSALAGASALVMAAAPADFATTTGSTRLPRGHMARDAIVRINGDVAAEGSESFGFTITGVSEPGVSIGDGSALLTIVDDDRVRATVRAEQDHDAHAPFAGVPALIVITFSLAVTQEIAARTGAVTGKGLAALIRDLEEVIFQLTGVWLMHFVVWPGFCFNAR